MWSVEHIVWDWNGTIFGDSRAMIDATVDAFARCGMPAVTVADYQREYIRPIPAFYERLAGRPLTDAEQYRLNECYQEAYHRRREILGLAPESVTAMSRWRDAGRHQSLLSMNAHDDLITLVGRNGIDGFFTRVDGAVGPATVKAPHLSRHLDLQGLARDRVIVIGDSLDDAIAAQECGAHCLLYHSGADALHAREHFERLGLPFVSSLTAAVEQMLEPRVRGALTAHLKRAGEPAVVGVLSLGEGLA